MNKNPYPAWYLPLKLGVITTIASILSGELRLEFGLSKGVSLLITLVISILLSILADKAMTFYQKKEKK